MTTSILGEKINFPICIAPTAMQRMANPEGELATARGMLNCFTCKVNCKPLSTFLQVTFTWIGWMKFVWICLY